MVLDLVQLDMTSLEVLEEVDLVELVIHNTIQEVVELVEQRHLMLDKVEMVDLLDTLNGATTQLMLEELVELEMVVDLVDQITPIIHMIRELVMVVTLELVHRWLYMQVAI